MPTPTPTPKRPDDEPSPKKEGASPAPNETRIDTGGLRSGDGTREDRADREPAGAGDERF